MKIKVENRHIKAGMRNSQRFCPVAIAIREALRKDCRVIHRAVWIDEKKYPLPRIAIENLKKFDKKEPVEPFEFQIAI